jgi:hypothetical protein
MNVHYGAMKDIANITNHQAKEIANFGAPNHQMQLGTWQLWRSLPRPCKLFLVVCVVQAFVAGAFAARELARVRLVVHLFILNNPCI